MRDYFDGVKKGLPIGLAYLAVSFAFGIYAVNGGISPVVAIILSFTNLTSAGQFSGVKLMIEIASYFEIFITVFVINIRYILMSVSLSQKIDVKTPFWKRILISFGITDEIYAIAINEKKKVTTSLMLGLTTLPLIGWTIGTALGALGANFLPDRILVALDIALYAMFIAIIIPDAKKSKEISLVCLVAIALSCIFEYVPYVNQIGLGFKIIISSVVACCFGALVFPRNGEEQCMQ